MINPGRYKIDVGGNLWFMFLVLLVVGGCNFYVDRTRHYELEHAKIEAAPMLPATVEEEK